MDALNIVAVLKVVADIRHTVELIVWLIPINITADWSSGLI